MSGTCLSGSCIAQTLRHLERLPTGDLGGQHALCLCLSGSPGDCPAEECRRAFRHCKTGAETHGAEGRPGLAAPEEDAVSPGGHAPLLAAVVVQRLRGVLVKLVGGPEGDGASCRCTKARPAAISTFSWSAQGHMLEASESW